MKLKLLTFLPPCLLLLPVMFLSFYDVDQFTAAINAANDWVSASLGWLVSLMAVVMLATCAIAYASPFGRVIIGGPEARPLLSKWNLFAVVVCINFGIGILFWGPIESVTHYSNPPESLGIAPRSPAAATFAMSTIFLHNTVLPLSFATLIGLMFAFAYYNMRKPFTLGAPLAPLLGRFSDGAAGQITDSICLYSLVVAMAAALGGTLLLIEGGINYYFNSDSSKSMLAIICAAMVFAYTIGAITGLTKGIKFLSNVKTTLFILFLSFIFVLGPTRFILNNAVESLGQFLSRFFEKALFTSAAQPRGFPQKWTQMHFSGWCAWAPLNGLFFGRIAYGYSVRSYLAFNIVFPAIFTGICLAIFCGAIVHSEMLHGAPLSKLIEANKDQQVIYAFMKSFQESDFITPVLLFVCFIAFITSASAVVSTMGGLCSTGVSPESPEPGVLLKMFWGILVGLVAWIMVAFARIDGIRMLSKLAGVPGLLFCVVAAACAFIVMLNPAKFDKFNANYDQDGNPRTHRR